MKVAVTGGSGRIGRELVRQLAERGHDTLSLDIVAPADLSIPHKVLDLRAPTAVRKVFDGQDAICHLAEWPGVWVGPAETYAYNTEVGSSIMAIAKQVGIGQFIYTSTFQIYGYWGGNISGKDPAPTLQFEETSLIRPQNAYALSKASNETFAQLMARDGQMPIAAFRFPSVVNGKQIDWNGRARHRNKQVWPEDFGTYVKVEDAALGYCLALERGWTGFEAFHFAADDTLFGGNMTQALLQQWPEIALPAGWTDETPIVSTAKARARLGWAPSISLRQPFLEAVERLARSA